MEAPAELGAAAPAEEAAVAPQQQQQQQQQQQLLSRQLSTHGPEYALQRHLTVVGPRSKVEAALLLLAQV